MDIQHWDLSQFLPRPEGNIYHYTGPEACCSILSNKTLRFTNQKYLNDTSEGIYILDLCESESNKICQKYPKFKEYFLKECKRKRNEYDITDLDTYQCSFSLDNDSLCLWNYYTKGESIQGYNLAFDPDEIFRALGSFPKNEDEFLSQYRSVKVSNPLLGNVIYEKDKQIKILQAMYNKFIEETPDKNLEGKFYWLASQIMTIGKFFKNECFRVENEFRISIEGVIHPEYGLFSYPTSDALEQAEEDSKQYNGIKAHFFVRGGVPVPYIDVSFPVAAIKAITISPTLGQSRAKNGLEALIRANFNNKIEIHHSRIPVRF